MQYSNRKLHFMRAWAVSFFWFAWFCIYAKHDDYLSWFCLAIHTFFALYYDGEIQKRREAAKKPSCFGTLEVVHAQCRAENDCEDCGHQGDCLDSYQAKERCGSCLHKNGDDCFICNLPEDCNDFTDDSTPLTSLRPPCYGCDGVDEYAQLNEGDNCEDCYYLSSCAPGSRL